MTINCLKNGPPINSNLIKQIFATIKIIIIKVNIAGNYFLGIFADI